jgi:hypothetical protein
MNSVRGVALTAVVLLVAVGGVGLAGVAAGDDVDTTQGNMTVNLVGDGDGEKGTETIALFEDELPPEYDVEYIGVADVNDSVVAETDIFVLYDTNEDAELLTTVEDDVATGAVYLDQASSSNGIPDRSAVIGDPEGIEEAGSSGEGPAEFVIETDHPIFDGVGAPGDVVEIHTESFGEITWFTGASGETLATAQNQNSFVDGGPAAAVDPDSGSVLLSSIAVNTFQSPGDFTSEANQTLANAVEFAQPPDLEGPYFSVSDLSAPAVAKTGAEINVSATVENIGNQSGTQTVEFVFNGSVVANTTETLASGANTTVKFTPTLPSETGTFEHGIQTANESQTATISVEEEFFAVSELSAPRTAAPGAIIDVNATVTNTGNVPGEQAVEFVFDGTVAANTTVQLDAGANTTVEFSPTLPSQEGFYEHGVFTDDDSQTAEIGVGVEFTDVAVVDSAEDDGDAPATVNLFADNLSPGFSTAVVASADILPNNLTDEYDIFVVQGIDEASVDVTELVTTIEDDVTTGAVYLDQGGFGDTYGITDRSDAIGAPDATDDDTGGTAPAEYVIQQDHPIFEGVGTAGDSVNITVGEDNRAWFSGAAGETLAEVGDQEGVDGAGVAVDPNSGAVLLSSIMVTSITTPDELSTEAGQILANAVEFAEPPELEGPYFAVSDLSAPAVGAVGEEINVSATVENIGNQSGEQTVEFVFDGTAVVNTTVQLDSGANTTVEFSPTLPDEGGEFQHGISTANSSQFAGITVEAPFFAVSELSAPSEAGPGDEINVSATVTNTGNVSGTQTVEFVFDGTAVANSTVQLEAGENTTVGFTDIPLPSAEGFYEHGVFTEDDSQTAEIGVGVEFTDVAVVENPGGDGDAAGTVSMFAGDLPVGFTVEIVSSADVLPNNLTDEYDVFVVQDIDEETVAAADLINEIENDTATGAIYLDGANFGDTFGIEDRSGAIGQPGNTDDTTSGEEPAEYIIQQDHPIFNGVGTAGDNVNITVGEDNRAWFSNTTATTLAEVGDQSGVDGTGVAVDADSQVVLLSSIMAHSLDSPDEFTAAANQTLANAVEFIDPAESAPNFQVSDLDAPAQAGAGTEIDVSATVTNVGLEAGTQTVEFVFDGSVVANTTETLNASENTTVEFTPTLPDASGIFEHGVQTANDSQTANITLIKGADFQVSDLSAPAEAVPGAEINVSANVTNVGDETATQTVEFRFDGSVVANTTETLNASESTTVEFTDIPLPQAEGTFEHGVFTDDDNQTANITVRPEPVTVTVVEGGTDTYGDDVLALVDSQLPTDGYETQVVDVDNVDATVVAETEVFVFNAFNISAGGDAADTRQRTDDAPLASASGVSEGVTTDTAELITSVEADITTGAVYLDQWGGDSDAIPDRASVTGDPAETDQAFGSGTGPVEYVIQQDSPLFDGVGSQGDVVTIHTADFADHTWFEGAAGDTLATVQNQEGSGGPAVAVDPDTGSVLLSSLGGTQFVGEAQYTTAAAQILANGVEVAEPPELSGAVFDVTGLTAPTQANVSATINVSATVTNVGNESGTQTVEFVFDGSVAASATVELNASEQTTVEFTPTLPGEGGVFEHGVQTANDSQFAEIQVGFTDVELVELVQPDELTLDGEIATEITITNNGTAPYEGEVLQVTNLNDTEPGSGAVAIPSNVTAVTLDPGENATFSDNLGTFADLNAALDTDFGPGDDVETGYQRGQNLAAAFEGGEATIEETYSEEISIVEEAFFEVSELAAPGEATPGAEIDVNATVTNTGGAGVQDVEFRFDGQTVANTTIELNASESTTVEFSPTLPEQTGTFTHGVFTEDDNETAEITVGSEFFAVSDLDAPTEADAGATIDVSATVTNTGELPGVQDVLFQFDGQTVANTTVDLSAGANTTVEFNTVQLPDEDAVFEHSVLTANDSQTAAIAVGDSEITNVTVVESDSFAEPGQGEETLAIFEEFLPTRLQPSVAEVQTVDDALINATDVFVFHDFGVALNDTEIEAIITTVENDSTTNAIYLEQRISSNAISERSDLLGTPNESPLNGNNGETPVEYTIQEEHPIFDGVGGPGDTVEIHSGGNGGFSWFEGAEGETLAEVQDQSVVGGPAVAVDPDSGAVLLASIATTDLFGEPAILTENYTDAAGQILANAVAFAEPELGPPNVSIADLSIAGEAADATVLDGSYDVSVEMTHTGGPAGAVNMNLSIGGEVINRTVSIAVGETLTVTFQNATDELTPGVYNVTVTAGTNAQVSGSLTLSVDVGGNQQPATDSTGDGNLNNLDGDEEFTIFDVQEFFVNFEEAVIQDNRNLFNFDESDDGEVTIFDVQALFVELVN